MGKRKSENKKGSKNNTTNKKDTKSKRDKSKETKKIEINKKGNNIGKNEKPKKKMIYFLIPILIIIGLIIIVLLIQSPVEASDDAYAQLIIDYGIVEIKQGTETWSIAENGMILYPDDTIKTFDNTSASVILFKSSIIRLDSNTEITILEIIREEETNVSISQNSGRTWNTIRKISGIDDYEVQTPTTVASVRGTSFMVNVTILGETFYGVVNGTVNVSSLENGTIVYSIEVNENESVFIVPEKIYDPIKTKPLKKDDWIIENELKDEEMIQEEKIDLYEKIEPYIPELKQRYGITDQEIDVIIEGYIRGYYKDHEFPEGIPDWIMELIEIA